MVSRRQFLRRAGAFAALSAMPLGRAARAVAPAKKLLVVFAYGGWDTTALLDPKPGDPEVDTPEGDWMDAGPLTLWRPRGLKSSAVQALRALGPRMGVVNGVAVNSLVHEAGLQMVLTGAVGDEHPADIAARTAVLSGADLPLPYLTNGSSARPMAEAALSGSVGYANQLSSLVVPEFAWPTDTRAFAPSGEVDQAAEAYLRAAHGGLTRRASPGPNTQKLADGAASFNRSAQIRAHALAGGFLSDPAMFYGTNPWQRAARALAEGFSQSVFIQDDGYWDTHGGNQAQVGLFGNLLEGLAQLMTALDEEGIGDDTVVLVLSEMGRSPLLNDLQGKDHWPYTSAFWLGAQVQPRVVRGTDAGLVLRPVGLRSGEPDADGRRLHAADVLATTAHLLGLPADTLYPHVSDCADAKACGGLLVAVAKGGAALDVRSYAAGEALDLEHYDAEVCKAAAALVPELSKQPVPKDDDDSVEFFPQEDAGELIDGLGDLQIGDDEAKAETCAAVIPGMIDALMPQVTDGTIHEDVVDAVLYLGDEGVKKADYMDKVKAFATAVEDSAKITNAEIKEEAKNALEDWKEG